LSVAGLRQAAIHNGSAAGFIMATITVFKLTGKRAAIGSGIAVRKS
jgi:hypothetical protein